MSHARRCHAQILRSIRSMSPFLSPPSSPASPAPAPVPAPSFFKGLVAAKKNTLIAIAKPACRARTTISRIFDVLASVELKTGYKLRRRKKTEAAKPRATKMKLRTVA